MDRKEEVIEAAKKGDVASLKTLLEADRSLANVRDSEQGWPALYWAVMHGCNARSRRNQPVVDLLIEYGAEVDLFAAAYLDAPERAAELLKADPALSRATDADGRTALHHAAEAGALAVAALLITYGADVNARDRKGRLPISEAAHPGPMKPKAATEIVDLLKRSGAEIDGFTAATLGDTARLTELIDADPRLVNAIDPEGGTALYHAAHNLHVEAVDLLLRRGADVDAKRRDGQTAISTAVDHAWDKGGPEVVERLLREGPEMAFFTACQAGRTDRAAALLDQDPSLVHALKWGYSALYLTSGNGHAGVIRLLLERGADPNLRFEHPGPTALHNAVWANRVEAARALLEAGADPNVKNRDGLTPLDMAVQKGREELADLLRQHGAKG